MHIHAHYQKRMWRGMPLVSSRCVLVMFPFKHVTGVYWKSPFSGLKGTSKRICELSFEMARSTSFCAGMLSLPCGQKETFFPLFYFCFFWAKIRKIFIFFHQRIGQLLKKMKIGVNVLGFCGSWRRMSENSIAAEQEKGCYLPQSPADWQWLLQCFFVCCAVIGHLSLSPQLWRSPRARYCH